MNIEQAIELVQADINCGYFGTPYNYQLRALEYAVFVQNIKTGEIVEKFDVKEGKYVDL